MAKTVAVYAGTFDPITGGHVDVVRRALKMFDSVLVAVAANPKKEPLFSLRERVSLTRLSLKHLKRARVEPFSGLLVDYLKKKKAHVILRGLRELSDFEYEFQQALMNRELYPRADTVFVMTSPQYFYVSSSIVKEVASLDCKKLADFVPAPVKKALCKKFKKKK